MIKRWEIFLEEIKVKGLKKKISKGGTFKNIANDIEGSGLTLKQVIKRAADKFQTISPLIHK